MNQLDKKYQQLLSDIITFGVEKKDRTGTGTISEFGHQIRHDMSEGFPLLTTKKMPFKTIVTELLWFLRGDTNIKYLVDNGCNIWNGDAYKNYSNKVQPWEPHLDENQFIERIKTNNEFAKKWGELGPIYGSQWRKWKTFTSTNPVYTRDLGLDERIELYNSDKLPMNQSLDYLHEQLDSMGVPRKGISLTKSDSVEYVDQITNLINDLKTNPDSRRLMVNAWNVGELNQMVLPPCHYGFQVYTRELTWEEQVKWVIKNTNVELENVYIVEEVAKETTPKRAISLMWNQRSVDTFLGLPFNIASYGLLLEIIAKEVNMVPDELIGNLGDVHLYSNHIEQAKELITRTPYKLPKLVIDQFDENNHYIGDMDDISEYNIEQFKLEGYQSHPSIKAPLSN